MKSKVSWRLNAARIVRLYLERNSTVTLAKKFGCNHSAIVGLLKRRGIPRRSRLLHLDTPRIVQLYESGLSMPAIAKQLGCTKAAVRYHLKGIQRNDRTLYLFPRGTSHYNWKGGRTYVRGYVRLRFPDGSHILEHRHVVEQHLKRKLTADEIVHHKNGIKDDNRIENLSVVTPQTHERHTTAKLLQARIRELEQQLTKSSG